MARLWTCGFEASAGGVGSVASRDGGFESGVSGWQQVNGTFTQSSVRARSGAFSGLLAVSGSPDQTYVRPPWVPVVSESSYRIVQWVFSPTAIGSVSASIDWFNASGGYLSTSAQTLTVPANTWTAFDSTAVAPAAAASASYGPTIGNNPSASSMIWVDDVDLRRADIEWDASFGPIQIVGEARSGQAALRCTTTGAPAVVQKHLYATTVSTRVMLRVYLNIRLGPSVPTTVLAWTSSTTAWVGVDLLPDGSLVITDSGRTVTSAASSPLTGGTWYRVELDYNDNTDTAVLYLDGVQVASQAGLNLGGGRTMQVGSGRECAADLLFDDLAVNDTTGSAQTGLPGPGRVVHLRPAAAGDNNAFETTVGGLAGASTNWSRVAEATPDRSASYNQTMVGGTSTVDNFKVTPSASAGIRPTDLVTVVQVNAQMGSDAATAASLVTRLKGESGGTIVESASMSAAVAGWVTNGVAAPRLPGVTSYTDPQTGGPWTPARLDVMQLGYRCDVAQTSTRRVSALWATVEYVPGPERLVAVNAGLHRSASW